MVLRVADGETMTPDQRHLLEVLAKNPPEGMADAAGYHVPGGGE